MARGFALPTRLPFVVSERTESVVVQTSVSANRNGCTRIASVAGTEAHTTPEAVFVRGAWEAEAEEMH